MVMGAKGKTNESFGSQPPEEFSAHSVSVEGLTLACLVLEGKKLDTNQHETSKTNTM